ncbi:hypothetical protein NDU88_011584 [Pleurodeles waltl]|uniref:Uncharacterized protein n=1 Tax=Pleurodeles waltl TaxID=8319 RepID=A0AAV7R235_PLEWA|nr:hypothetical protein NDU88_011584 [Pleurodeles waltl]
MKPIYWGGAFSTKRVVFRPVRGPAPCSAQGASASSRPGRTPAWMSRTTTRHVCRDPRDGRRRGCDEILRLGPRGLRYALRAALVSKKWKEVLAQREQGRKIVKKNCPGTLAPHQLAEQSCIMASNPLVFWTPGQEEQNRQGSVSENSDWGRDPRSKEWEGVGDRNR